MLMRKPRSHAEILNDRDSEVVGLFRVLRDRDKARDLEFMVRNTPFSREEFDLGYEKTSDDLERCRRLLVRSQMAVGMAGFRSESRTGFRANTGDAGTTAAQDWAGYPDGLKAYTERLQGVVIEDRDALEVMGQHDSGETLHFVDPPYVLETRGAKSVYRHEMTNEQHEQLCDFLKTLKGMVILCGYHNPIYDRLGWQTVKREAHADGARDRVEVLWFNPAAWAAQPQARLL